MKTTVIKNAAITTECECEPIKLLKKIGSTTIEVVVHFKEEGSETMADIVRRMIEREVDKSA